MTPADRQIKGTNGRRDMKCPVNPECSMSELVKLLVEDVERQIAEHGDSVGETVGRIDDRLNSIALHVSDVGERQVKADEREVEWLATLQRLEKQMGEAMRLLKGTP
jgi:septation ring formation regulator EzrA